MNNKKIFSLGLFIETFMHLRVVGIIAALVTIGIQMYPKVMLSIRNLDYDLRIEMFSKNTFNEQLSVALIFIVFVPILSLFAWNFLNNREASDFYYSLAHTRVSLFLSRFAGIIAWVFVILVISYISNIVSYAIFMEYYVDILDYNMLFRLYLASFICSLLVAAVFSVGCAVSGHIMNSILVSVLVILVPRIIMSLLSSAIVKVAKVVISCDAIPFIDEKQNMLVSWISGLYDCMFNEHFNYKELIVSDRANIYTLVIAVIYIVIGLVLFKIRNNEYAGEALAIGGVSQIVKIIIVTAMSTVGAVRYVINVFHNEEAMLSEIISSSLLAMLIGSVAAVIIYEYFLEDRKVKIKSCIMTTVIGWGIAALLGIFVCVRAQSIIDYKPDTDNVKYVVINYDNKEESYGYRFRDVINTLKYDDKKVIDIVTNALKNNVEFDSTKSLQDGDVRYYIYFDEGGHGEYRIVYLSAEKEKVLVDYIKETPEFINAYFNYSDEEYTEFVTYCSDKFTEDEKRQLYKYYLEEREKLSFEEHYESLILGTLGYVEDAMGIEVTIDGLEYMHVFTVKHYPKTIHMYRNLCYKYEYMNSEPLDRVKEVLEIAARGKVAYVADGSKVWARINMPDGRKVTISSDRTATIKEIQVVDEETIVKERSIENSEELISELFPIIKDNLKYRDDIDITNRQDKVIIETGCTYKVGAEQKSADYDVVLDNLDVDWTKY